MPIRKELGGFSPATIAHMDELLDEALNETFPASDSVAINFECTSNRRVDEWRPVPTTTTKTNRHGI
jgi:hypothetical protein